eukprot:1124841-Prymnesium_polylepis.1
MSARTRTATAELERACQPVLRSMAALRVPKPTWLSAQAPNLPQCADSRTAARECEPADIIAQRAGR